MQSPEKLVRFIPNAGNPFSRSEAKKFKPEVNALGFVVSAISALFKGFVPTAGAFVIVSLNSQPNEIGVIYGSVKAIAHL